jgi:hypothetical protein
MVAKVFLGCIMILSFLVLYPYMMSLWTDNVSGLNRLMANMTTSTGAPAMSSLETSIWGLFPLTFLVLCCGGIVWLMVRDKDR